MSEVIVDVPTRWTVEVEYPDRDAAFAAARQLADQTGQSAAVYAWPVGGEDEGWRVKPGTPSVADVIAGRAEIPVRHLRLAQLLALATPDEVAGLRARLDIELSATAADAVWRAAQSCVHLFRSGPGFDN